MSLTKCLCSIMDANHLAGLNFINWLSNLKILLKYERITYVLEEDGPVEPALDVCEDEVWKYKQWQEDSTMIQCYMWPQCAMSCKGNMKTWNQEPCYSI